MKRVDIESITAELAEAARAAGNVAVVVGPGVSADAGIPSVRELLQKAITAAYEQATPELRRFAALPHDPVTTDLLLRSISQEDVATVIKHAIRVPSARPSKVHRVLADFRNATFVTLNYDKLLEQALEGKGRDYTSVVTDDDIRQVLASPRDTAVVRLCGDPDRPSTLRLSLHGTEVGVNTEAVESYVRALLGTRLTLFIGFPLESTLLSEIYERFWSRASFGLEWVLVNSAESRFSRFLWEDRGVRVTDIPTGQLIEFLNAFRRAFSGARHKPATTKLSNRKRVFISAPIEGARMLHQLTDKLEQSGFAVTSHIGEFSLGSSLAEHWQHSVEGASAAIVIVPPNASEAKRRSTKLAFELGYLMGRLGAARVLVMAAPDAASALLDVAGAELMMVDPRSIGYAGDAVGAWVAQLA